MLQVKDVSISFEHKPLLTNISFTLHEREKVALVGNNGVGKTTLLRIITGEITPDMGKVIVARKVRGKIGYIPQSLPRPVLETGTDVMHYMMSGRDLVVLEKEMKTIEELLDKEFSDHLFEQYTRLQDAYLEKEGYRSESEISKLLNGVGLREIALEQRVQTLSGGQKSRLALAKMLYEQTRILLLDEPTNQFDIRYTSFPKGILCVIEPRNTKPDGVVTILNNVLGNILPDEQLCTLESVKAVL